MLYSTISKARDIWYSSKECTINELINYIQGQNALRDAQLEAIKTYLFLKIACDNKPLYQLFCEGVFNAMDSNALANESISQHLREFLNENKAALALYEYSKQNADKALFDAISQGYKSLDYEGIFKQMFYGVSYTDYLFSLPMGAGKTYLMAAFIYLDLYFAKSEPRNKAFAHNFLILAPSGLKSSILPSLKNIQHFNPAWILPEPSASELKGLIKFEILNENKSASKSNKTKNPNVAKIAQYQPFSDTFGVVLLTNAEKVILDRIDKEPSLFSNTSQNDKMAWQAANELREFIGKIPNLSIFIDEVHHATASNNNDNEVKLRKVVSQWSKRESVITIAGFSGTPYLKSEEKIPINSSLTIKHKQIANTVYYYPLLKGIGNFLKTPIVKISNSTNRLDIVEAGLREFLENSRLYENSLHSKIAIYCASIKNLEEQIYPKVCAILSEYQLNQTAVLKFHRGDKDKIYPEPENAQSTFDTLDYNKNIKVVLLVDIGKEGWDCKSLSGVILSQENKSKKNMVLQTSCRCLRQIDKNADEKALIYLNDSNAKELSSQLKAEQKIDIDEFQSGAKNEQISITRYDRTDKIKLPPLEFYQIKLHYDKTITQEANPKEALVNLNLTKQSENLIIQKDFKDKTINTFLAKNSQKEQHANFTQWLYEIAKDSLNTLSLSSLKAHAPALREIFTKITHSQNDRLYFKAEFNKAAINSSIRKAFSPKRNFTTTTELVPQSARLLLADKLYSPLMINSRSQENAFIPNQEITKEIIRLDKENTPQAMPTNEEKETLIKFLGEKDAKKYIANKEKTLTSHYLSHKDKSFHYIPYRTDSKLERTIFDKILQADEFKALNLELYYNGDRSLSEFHIQTYKDNAKLGLYTPDFLVLKRKNGVISKLLIVESKGEIYALNFEHKKKFMDEFIALNNEKSGYAKFGFLYIEDTQSESEQIIKIQSEIQNFFKDKD